MRHLYSPSFPFRLLLAVFFTVFLLKSADAQIKIGTNGATIAPASLLELESANQGLLLPRMSDTVAINALNPPNGMLIYLTRQPAVGLYVRKVTGWEYLTGSLGGNGNFNSMNVTGTITAGNFSGPLTGNASTSTLATTATNSVNSAVTNDVTTPGTTYPAFVNGSPGNQPLHTSTSNLTYVPATGILTAKGFNGPLVGDVTGLSTSAVDAQNAVNIKITDDQVTTASVFPVFVTANAGPLPPRVSSTMLSFIPSTGMLSAKGFVGPLNGNATSASTAVNATNSVNSGITNDLQTSIPAYPTFVLSASGNLPLKTSSNARLSFVPSTGILTASGFNGPLVGNVTGTSTASVDAQNTVNVRVTDDSSNPAINYPTFVGGTSGPLPEKASPNLSFIPSTGELKAVSFNGSLNATNVTGIIAPANGGTGVNNTNTLTLSGGNVTIISAGAPLTFPLVAGYKSEVKTITVNGAADGDPVSLGTPNLSVTDDFIYFAWVSALNTVSVRCTNLTAVPLTPAAGTFKVKVFK